MRSKMKSLIRCTLLVNCAACAFPAMAQEVVSDTPEPVEQSGEIVVTATKRSERLTDVPATVQAFTSADIERKGIQMPQDFLNTIPSVTMIQGSNAGESFINIRGQSSARGAESTVAIVVDGVQLANQNEFNGQLFGLQQIEVLKGPWGAIYGRNAAAGAIIVTTKAPTDELSGEFQAGYGNYNSSMFNGTISGAVIPDVLRFRLTGSLTDSDGTFTNEATGEKVDRTKAKSVRGRMIWDAASDLQLDLRMNFSKTNGGGIPGIAQGPGIVIAGEASPVDANNSVTRYTSEVPGSFKRRMFDTSLKADYDLGFANLTSVTAYSSFTDTTASKLAPYLNLFYEGNDAGSSVVFGDQTQKYSMGVKLLSQELRLTSQGDDTFKWQVGVYANKMWRRNTIIQGLNGSVNTFDEDGNPVIGYGGLIPDENGSITVDVPDYLPSTYTRALDGGGAILPGLGLNGVDTINPTVAYDVTKLDGSNFAPFANVQIEPITDLTIMVAGRYDIEHRSVVSLTPDIINPFSGTSFNTCVATMAVTAEQCRDGKTFRQFQPRISANYKLGGLGSIYASWGKSFKSGGFNQMGSRATVVEATYTASSGTITREEAEALVFLQDDYKKEVSETYEAGFKLNLFDRILNLNGAAYHTKIKNAQDYLFFPAGSVQAVTYIDGVRINGVEIDGKVRVSQELSLTAAYSYNDAEITSFEFQPDSVGNTPPNGSKYTLSTGAQLSLPISRDWDMTGNVDYNRLGPVYYDAANTEGTRRDPVDLVNGRITFKRDQLSFSLWGRNLLNTKYASQRVVLPTGVGTFLVGFMAPLRTYGADVKVTF